MFKWLASVYVLIEYDERRLCLGRLFLKELTKSANRIHFFSGIHTCIKLRSLTIRALFTLSSSTNINYWPQVHGLKFILANSKEYGNREIERNQFDWMTNDGMIAFLQ